MGREIARRFLIVAGEASGDAHAARLVAALRELGPCECRGVAGPALISAGVEAVVPMEDLAVIGFSGVLARAPRLLRAYRRVLAEAASFRPDAALLVDSPGFNLRIGPELARRGIRTFYFIAPQVWAWHAERAAAMARWVDRLAVVFPFEEELFRAAGVNATFVGHPLLESLAPEVDEATLRSELGAGPRDRIVGLLPGSRAQEFRAHAGVLRDAARLLRRGRPDLVPVVPIASGLDSRALERVGFHGTGGKTQEVRAGGAGSPWEGVRVVRGRTRAVQAFATACAVASGTATLETALFGTPLVVFYRMGRINYEIARRVVKLPRVGLPNIVAGAEVAPELIQDDLTPEALAAALAPWLDDPAARAAASRRLHVVRERLGAPGAAERAARLLWELAS